jgi:hypothetical protein
MSKKIWYEIELECIKDNANFSCVAGEKQIIAKVKSVGLAYQMALKLQEIYDKEHWKVIICL